MLSYELLHKEALPLSVFQVLYFLTIGIGMYKRRKSFAPGGRQGPINIAYADIEFLGKDQKIQIGGDFVYQSHCIIVFFHVLIIARITLSVNKKVRFYRF